jgi:hypothetical protein
MEVAASMNRLFSFSALALVLAVAPLQAAPITGKYVEARTCDVWTGPCFANAEFNLTGKHAVLAWKVEKGSFEGANLDGLSVVAVVSASDTLGLEQTGPAQAVLIVDSKANASQRQALIHLAQKQGGKLLRNVVAVRKSPIQLEICDCKGKTCAEVQTSEAHVKTRCLDQHHDKVCGNESAFFPPLTRGVNAQPAAAVEHTFRGDGLGMTWSDFDRRSAYVGTFEIR